MQSLEIIQRLYEYDQWANVEIMRYFWSAEPLDKKALRVFAHLLLAEKVWLQRIFGENSDSTGVDFWAGETIEDAVTLFEENRKTFDIFFNNLTEKRLAEVFTYKNSKGIAFHNVASEALTHVFMHSGYHRGQVAQAIRESGDDPPNTDFIQFLRQK